MATVMTVTGPVQAEALGLTLMHEHLLLDLTKDTWTNNNFLSDPDLTVSTMYDAVKPTGTPKASNRFYFLVDQKGKVIWRSVNGSLIPTDQLIADLGKVLASQQ